MPSTGHGFQPPPPPKLRLPPAPPPPVLPSVGHLLARWALATVALTCGPLWLLGWVQAGQAGWVSWWWVAACSGPLVVALVAAVVVFGAPLWYAVRQVQVWWWWHEDRRYWWHQIQPAQLRSRRQWDRRYSGPEPPAAPPDPPVITRPGQVVEGATVPPTEAPRPRSWWAKQTAEVVDAATRVFTAFDATQGDVPGEPPATVELPTQALLPVAYSPAMQRLVAVAATNRTCSVRVSVGPGKAFSRGEMAAYTLARDTLTRYGVLTRVLDTYALAPDLAGADLTLAQLHARVQRRLHHEESV